jgi:hypothetical protein
MLGIIHRSRSFVSRRRTLGRHFLSTYYDSQSGMHIPIHKEQEITLILNKSQEDTSISSSSFVPAQLYKEDASSDMPEKLQSLKSQGIHGVILPPARFPRDIRNLQTLSHIAPPNFMFFSSFATLSQQPLSSIPTSLSMLLEYSASDAGLEESMKWHVKSGMKTTISIRETIYKNGEPISIASQIAKLIDMTGGVDFMWLCCGGGSPSSNKENIDADDVIRLCEELVYLDVAGPTIKSRMVVDSTDPEIVEETMMSGVNKFVIEDEGQVQVVEDIAKEQGKIILR